MSLGERLRKYLPEGIEQKVVAMNWIARLEKAGTKSLSATTAQSRLSELLADDPQGVRAFFREPVRSKALFDELNVPEAERAELRALAEPILAGTTRPRLVADVSDLGTDRATMIAAFAGLRDALFGDDGVFPVLLVLTDAQYDLLPRSFDRFKERMQVERVADAAAGADTAIRLAGDSTCVIGHRPLVDLARWWALDVDQHTIHLEPADGLSLIRANGSLGIPAVAFPLDALPIPSVVPTATVSDLPTAGVARRRLVADLADEASAASKNAPSWRIAVARELGVRATSTARERVEAEIADLVSTLGMKVTSGSDQSWDALVARAARRPTEPIALRVGDTVKVLNPAAGITSAGRLEVARVTCAEPRLVTLEKAVAQLSEDELLDDPLLSALIHRLAGRDERSLDLLFHARAVLVYGGRVRAKASRAAKDPLAVLQHILANDVPPALLRISVDGPPQQFGSESCSVLLAPFAYPDTKIYFKRLESTRLLYGVPPVGDVLFARESKLHAVVPQTGHEPRDLYYVRHRETANSPSALVDPKADAAKWLDDIEGSPFFGATAVASGWDAARHLPEPEAAHTWKPVGEPAGLWANADTQLALAWLALRSAMQLPRSIRLPDGSVLLQIGGGLAARIVARRHGQPNSAVRGAVRCTVSRARDAQNSANGWQFGDLSAPVTTHVADTGHHKTRISVLMPSLWIAGCGYAADVSFIAAPMLPGNDLPVAAVGAATVGAVAAIDAAARAATLQAMWADDE